MHVTTALSVNGSNPGQLSVHVLPTLAGDQHCVSARCIMISNSCYHLLPYIYDYIRPFWEF